MLEHKKNVFKTCWSKGLYLQAFTHDLSKFSPIEFVNYAKEFHKDEAETNFHKAWQHHIKKNKHHWQHWLDGDGQPQDIPDKYLKEMVADWEAMAIKFGDSAQGWYLLHYKEFNLTRNTRLRLEKILGIYHQEKTLEELIDEKGEEWWSKSFGSWIEKKYGFDLIEVLKKEA